MKKEYYTEYARSGMLLDKNETKTTEKALKDLNHMYSNLWERVRRNPEYVKLCADVKFYEWGGVSARWVQKNPEKYVKAAKMAESEFGISQLVDPKKPSSELQSDFILEVLPKMVEVLMPAETEFDTEDDYKKRFLEDDKYLTVRIDISKKQKYIRPLLQFYIDYYKQLVETESGREHHKNYYEVWDRRKKGTPYSKIAKELGISSDTAKDWHYKAYELITGNYYDPEDFKRMEIQKGELPKTCETCPDRDTCTELCPDVLAYVDQDHIKRKEGKPVK